MEPIIIFEEDVTCPITLTIMSEPVIMLDGKVYEKDAIKKWLQDHSSSPLTRKNMSNAPIIVSISYQKLIREYISSGNTISINEEDIKCPITGLILLEPVYLSDGKFYERSAIEKSDG